MLQKLATGVLATAGLLTASVASAETAFTPDAETVWIARSLRMADLTGAGTDIKTIQHTLGKACDGLTGEQVGHEYGKAPRWAIGSQMLICYAYNGWAHKMGGTKGPCKTIEQAIEQLNMADSGGYSPAIVDAAHTLRTTETQLVAAARAEKHACKL